MYYGDVLTLLIGACVEIVMNDSRVLKGIYFQDQEMKDIFAAYPEFICIDATYMLLELRFPVYFLLVEDGNGLSEIAAVFLMPEETEESMSHMIDFFKKENSNWKSIRVVMGDKDLSQRCFSLLFSICNIADLPLSYFQKLPA